MNRRKFVKLTSVAVLACTQMSRGLLAGIASAEDSNLGLLYDDIFLEHWLQPGHPESPERLRAIVEALNRKGLFQETRLVSLTTIEPDSWIEMIHTPAHMLSIATHYPQGDRISRLVISGVLQAVNDVCSGRYRNAFCATRPPGHHAGNSGFEEGFCFYNTVAVAARYAQIEVGLERVLIVDWDYHHGNGTELAFYTDPSVLFFSTHDLYAYPHTGYPGKTGSGRGKGYNINVHLPCGTTDQMIIDAFMEKLVPATIAFKPDLILVSAGFDSVINDPLGCHSVTSIGFSELTRIVVQLADEYCEGRIVSVLEGGYNLQGLARATVTHVQAMLNSRRS